MCELLQYEIREMQISIAPLLLPVKLSGRYTEASSFTRTLSETGQMQQIDKTPREANRAPEAAKRAEKTRNHWSRFFKPVSPYLLG